MDFAILKMLRMDKRISDTQIGAVVTVHSFFLSYLLCITKSWIEKESKTSIYLRLKNSTCLYI